MIKHRPDSIKELNDKQAAEAEKDKTIAEQADTIELLKGWGYEVEERRISAEELFEAAENGTLEEAWGTGTAAVVSPIGELAMEDKKVTVSGGKIGPITQKLYDELTGIQWGRVADPHNWITKL